MTAAMRLLGARSAAGFNPETDIDWHSLFWAEGTAFTAQGYGDGDSVGTSIPDEAGSNDFGLSVSYPATLDADGIGGQPAFNLPNGTGSGVIFGAVVPQPYTIVYLGLSDALGAGVADRWMGGKTTSGGRLIVTGGTTYSGAFASFSGWAHSTEAGMRFLQSGATSEASFNGTTTTGMNPGTQGLPGLALGAETGGGRATRFALFGIYEGDITADSSWSSFVAWVEDYYGLAIA